MCELSINVSSLKGEFEGHTEIDISGTTADFLSFSYCLTEFPTKEFSLRQRPTIYYPISLHHLSLELVDQSNQLITMQIEGVGFKITGDLEAFQKLRSFLESLSNLRPGEHFHLDWFADEDLLAPATTISSFIFSVLAEDQSRI
ncbi:hypothetical protein [Hymenobacter yonginensis]|uniref:Uncharacterized protein n=1 Tax=Hymenobacter yonginensis TaxID=748197 RepID=A0ABY7PMI5_9BACT|nr:hypothetical protein [Hymenobacter yonginensis]WBO84177.1 hypothetical protein O9Z63_17590 [Hymenobacter yonginensis]